ncbi:Histidinol phosphatase of the PHP family protein [Luteitalea pratensis]|uniref:Histidinol phosphatase of the PHP family protein n=1 Tax=Luteitalea pratensis TaxID=1855912 RepID=A0A143PPI9_LUTPR|nr:Histidinol phosphatase of the PHP family protein [Luteitalea pratensis]
MARQPPLWRGAYHVHSTQSDGSGTPEAIAAAAAGASLDFVILTDHGDGTRTPAGPRIINGVLLIDAVEISTDDGHYVALDLPPVPYPLAGEGRAVAEDVRRLGGMGLIAHPDSLRSSLAWHDPSVAADGFEWINGDSTWRTASTAQLLVKLLAYPLNRAGTLAGLARYPAALFAERDQPARGPQLALAAVDAHARIGWQRSADPIDGGRTLSEFPSYRASFGTFGVVVPWLDGTPSGDARRDAVAVLAAIRHRVTWSAVFSMADPVWLSFDLIGPATMARPGRDADGEATVVVKSNGPAGASIRVLRNGHVYREAQASALSAPLPADEPGSVYRAELWLPARRGWPALPVAISAARGHNLPDVTETGAGYRVPGTGHLAPGATTTNASADDVDIRGWHVEHDPRSSGMLRPASPGTRGEATLRLAGGERVSQFSALVGVLAPPPAGATGLELELSASAAMRLSVQWREPRSGEGLRWRHSCYVDGTRRVVALPMNEFRPIRPATGRVPLDRIHALLLVMDTVNARPGDSRTVTVHAARWTAGR